jgi:hypothetical protein
MVFRISDPARRFQWIDCNSRKGPLDFCREKAASSFDDIRSNTASKKIDVEACHCNGKYATRRIWKIVSFLTALY